MFWHTHEVVIFDQSALAVVVSQSHSIFFIWVNFKWDLSMSCPSRKLATCNVVYLFLDVSCFLTCHV